MNYQSPIPQTLNESKDQTIETLTKQVDKLTMQVNELAKRVSFLERENNRRKSDLTQISNNKKG